MALVLDATPGGSASNSYATAAEGDSYHERRLHVSDWTNATTAQKEAGLVWATSLLDIHIEWDGFKFNLDQKLRWPRSGVVDRDGDYIETETIPGFLKDATAELARVLIASDRSAEVGTKGFRSISVGPITLDIDKDDVADSLPDHIYEMVSAYGTRIHSRSGGLLMDVVRA